MSRWCLFAKLLFLGAFFIFCIKSGTLFLALESTYLRFHQKPRDSLHNAHICRLAKFPYIKVHPPVLNFSSKIIVDMSAYKCSPFANFVGFWYSIHFSRISSFSIFPLTGHWMIFSQWNLTGRILSLGDLYNDHICSYSLANAQDMQYIPAKRFNRNQAI